VYTNGEELSPREISGYVTCVYDNQWWVAYTLEIHDDTEENNSEFPSPTWAIKYPSRPDIFTVSCAAVIY